MDGEFTSDLLAEMEPNAKRAKPDEGISYRLEHFKVTHDQTWDYKEIADKMFDGPKVLVQYEKWSSKPHVHYQGYTSYAPRTFENMKNELAAKHYTREKTKGSRPVKSVRKEVTEKGFQYLMKEGHAPEYSRGFTPDELDELAKQSVEYVKELKIGMTKWMHEKWLELEGERAITMSPEDGHVKLCLLANEYYNETGKTWSLHHRRNMIETMRTMPGAPQSWVVYAMKNM